MGTKYIVEWWLKSRKVEYFKYPSKVDLNRKMYYTLVHVTHGFPPVIAMVGNGATPSPTYVMPELQTKIGSFCFPSLHNLNIVVF